MERAMLEPLLVFTEARVLKQKRTAPAHWPAPRPDVCKANSIKLRRYTSE
jgi:hypothetical protein